MNRLTPICSASISVRSTLPKRTDHALQTISPNYHFKMQLLASASNSTSSREGPHPDSGHSDETFTADHVSPTPSLPAMQFNPTRADLHDNGHPPLFAAFAHGPARTGPLEQQKLGGRPLGGIGTNDKLQSFRWYSSAAATPYVDSKAFSSGL